GEAPWSLHYYFCVCHDSQRCLSHNRVRFLVTFDGRQGTGDSVMRSRRGNTDERDMLIGRAALGNINLGSTTHGKNDLRLQRLDSLFNSLHVASSCTLNE